MKIVFFTFYYPPDLCAGSFRSIALTKSLKSKLNSTDQIDVITCHPNRYKSHSVVASDTSKDGIITIHRIKVPSHKSTMISQCITFVCFAYYALKISKNLKPDFVFGTTSRLMTGFLAFISATYLNRPYFIDLRDIFSETISDLFYKKNKFLGLLVKYCFSRIEKRVLRSASGVNVVSRDFPKYFNNIGVDTSNWTFYPNGVDEDFLDFSNFFPKLKRNNNIKTILYAGNIGKGQGLELIIPKIAKELNYKYLIKIIGDGTSLSTLKKIIELENINNVKFIPPIGRDKLINYYQEADILFLHLNDLPAFKRVLPSKIFEYAAIGRPIIAGLSGYSANFIKENIPYALIFNPGDSNGAIEKLLESDNITISKNEVEMFVSKYSRKSLMNDMADNLLLIIRNKDIH
jgi:UDP-N-acetylglucosamine:LPS N-acetylglucosamine transferase